MDERCYLMMVTYNRLDLTKETLDDLVKSVDYPSVLVIIDNGSTDGTVNFLQEYKPGGKIDKYHVIFNTENKGIAIGRNQALKYAMGRNAEWLSTVDNDVKMPIGWLSECIDILKNCPQYAMIGVNMEGKEYPIVESNSKRVQLKPPPSNLGTACMVFNKRIPKMIGFFNYKDYPGGYGLEDTDYSLRLRALQMKLCYIERMGIHLGVGDRDTGEYREFKTKTHDKNVPIFQKNCQAYFNRTKSLYISYEDT